MRDINLISPYISTRQCSKRQNKNPFSFFRFFHPSHTNMIVPVEKIRKPKKNMAKKVAKLLSSVFLVKRECYPIGEINDGIFVNAEVESTVGAMTRASINSVLKTTTKQQQETQEEPPSLFSEHVCRYATIRRSYSVRYKYSLPRFHD